MEELEINTREFDHLKTAAHLVHGVFTRPEPHDFLNTGLDSRNEMSAAAKNRKRIIRKMGMNPLIFLNQVHGDTIKVFSKDDTLLQPAEPGKAIYTADAAITNIKGVFLVILVADCQSVMLYDPDKEVIANIHSGWRGSILNIIGQCLGRMISEFGCRPENILAGISPSLGPCCSEFKNYKDEIPDRLWKYKQGDTEFFDFWSMSRDQLTEKGVKMENIRNMGVCTKCHTDMFYSYRGEKTADRFACVISMI